MKIDEKDGYFYPMRMFKLFWLIPTGIYVNQYRLEYDLVIGEYEVIAKYKTRKEAENYKYKTW